MVLLYPVLPEEVVKFTTGAERAEEECFGKSHRRFQAGRASLPTVHSCQAASTNTLPLSSSARICIAHYRLGRPFEILLESWALKAAFIGIKAQGEHLIAEQDCEPKSLERPKSRLARTG